MVCRSILPSWFLELTFNSVKDYDDYIARLKKVPLAFQQITDDMSIGMDDHREPPAYLMEKALAEVNAIANQKPQDGPLISQCESFRLLFRRPNRRVSRRNCFRRSPGR